MAGEGKGADNIGTLSVDILADLTKFSSALDAVEKRLSAANKDITIKLSIPEAQIARLQKAAELIERIQKTGVPDLSGVGGGVAAPTRGRGAAASASGGKVNVAIKEEDLTKAFRAAAVAAFAQPIPGVKLDLDIAHIQQQLQGLNISFTGGGVTTGVQQAAQQGRVIPQALREQVNAPKIQGAIDDMFTAFNVALKRANQPLLQGADAAAKFVSIADKFGDRLTDIVQLGKAEGPYGRPVTGGATFRMLENAADDVADKLEEAGRTFYERLQRSGVFDAYRSAGGRPAQVTPVGGPTQYAASGSEQKAVQLAQLRAAEAQTQVARRQAAQPAIGARSGVPQSIDDINNMARQLAAISGYDVRRAQGNLTRPWQDFERENVAGRRAYGPRGLTAFGRVGTSQGTDITDILMAAGPGARMLQGFGEIMQQGRGSGQYVSLSPQEQEFLRGQTRRQGAAAGHPMVQAVAPREMLQRMLLANRGVGFQEAREISQWALRSGGPLNARDLGPQLSSSTGEMRSLSSLMSAGGGTIEAEARDELRLQRLENERRELAGQLAGTGVPSEQRRLRAQIANRAGQIRRLQTIQAGAGVTGAQNRQMIEEGFGAETNPLTFETERLGIDPLSPHRTRMADRPAIVEALIQMSNFMGDQEGFNRQIEDVRSQLLGGYLPFQSPENRARIAQGLEPEPQRAVGGMTGTRGTGQQLFDEIRQIVNGFREAVGLPATKGRNLKSMTRQLEGEGFPVQAAAIQTLFGERATRLAMAEQAVASYPQRTGMTEARMTGQPGERRGTVAPGGRLEGGRASGRMTGDISVGQTARRRALQEQYESYAREFEFVFGRSGSAEHDPMAAGLPPGSWEQMGVLGEKGPKGTHPRRLQPMIGEIDKVKRRIGEQVAREMGVRFGEGGEPVFPSSGAVTARMFEEAVKARTAEAVIPGPGGEPMVGPGGTPITVAMAEQERAFVEERMNRMRRILRRHQESGAYRTGAPDVTTGDEDRARFYAASNMAPGGGVPLTREEIRSGAKRPLQFGAPATTTPGPASQLGPVNLPGRGIGGGGGGGETTEASPMFGGRTVHVWIDGPFPLRTAMQGGAARTGRGGSIEQAMAAGDVAGSQAENIAEGVARGGTRASGGAVRTGRGQGSRVNLDEMRAAAAATPVTEAGPLGKRRQLGPGGGQAFDFPIEVDPAGVARLQETAAQQAARRANEQRTARESARSVRRPSRTELLQALAGGGATAETLQQFASPINELEISASRVSPAVLRARQAAREAQARLPSRALSTSIVQLSQRVFGGRQEPEQRIFELQRVTGRLQALETRGLAMRGTRAETFLEMRRAREEIRGREAAGTAVPEALRREFEGAREAVKGHTKEINENAANIEKAAGKVATLGAGAVKTGDVLRNLAAGFVGGIGGGLVTLGVSAAIQGVGAAAEVAQKALQPAYDAAIDYQNVTNEVVGSLSDQTRANRGLADKTVALAAAQAGLGYATFQSIGPHLEEAAAVEAGNKAYSDYINMIRAGRRIEDVGGAPRGLYETTGGLNILGLQTPFGGTPAGIENFMNQFVGVQAPTGGIFGTQPSADVLTNFFAATQSIASIPKIVGAGFEGLATGNFDALKEVITEATGADTSRRALEDINAMFAKTGADFAAQRGAVAGPGSAALARAAGRAGVPTGTIERIMGLGIEFTDAQGNVITDLNQLDLALKTWVQNIPKLDPQTWLESLTGPSGGLTAQIFGAQQQGALARQTGQANFMLGRIAQPPVRLADVLAGMPGVPQAFQPTGGGGPPAELIQGMETQGLRAMQDLIEEIQDPTTRREAQATLTDLQGWGQALQQLQVSRQQIQFGQMFRQMGRDIELSKRSLSDVLGLTGRSTEVLRDGSNVRASNLGVLQGENMLLSRNLQLLQFEHQQRSINYQIALAGFMAEGATGEERAARLEVAEREAQYQKDLLGGQRQLADNQWQVTQIENERAYQDLVYQTNEILTRRDEAGRLANIDEKIQQWAAIIQMGTEEMGTYLNEGAAMIQLAIGVSQELLQMGVSAADAIYQSAEALDAAGGRIQYWLQSSGSWGEPTTGTGTRTDPRTGVVTIPFLGNVFNPPSIGQRFRDRFGGQGGGSFIPGSDKFDDDEKAGGGPGLVATPMGIMRGGGINVQIVNPQAGVDTQSLTRVVIGELNRQAALRGVIPVN